jgi:hypothetical protein
VKKMGMPLWISGDTRISTSNQTRFCMKKSIWILLSLVFAAATAFSPGATRTIRGKVTSAADGTAITGATVILKGTRTGAVSQGDGTYQLAVPAGGGALIFSFIGYVSQTVNLGKSDTVNVQLKEDVTQLNEVVVTGYGVEKRRDIAAGVTRPGRKRKSESEAVTVSSRYHDVHQAPVDYEALLKTWTTSPTKALLRIFFTMCSRTRSLLFRST